jgi:hypothetical protein
MMPMDATLCPYDMEYSYSNNLSVAVCRALRLLLGRGDWVMLFTGSFRSTATTIGCFGRWLHGNAQQSADVTDCAPSTFRPDNHVREQALRDRIEATPDDAGAARGARAHLRADQPGASRTLADRASHRRDCCRARYRTEHRR